MIESIDNMIQLVVTGACTSICLYRAVRGQGRAWTLLGLFSGIFFLGDLYWQLFLLFYQDTPEHYTVSELSWYTSYLFLLLLVIYVRVEICGHRMPTMQQQGGLPGLARSFPPVLWCIPLFTGGMCVLFMQWGDYVSNLIAAGLMTGLLWHALSGILAVREDPGKRMLFSVILLFCLAEYAMWVSSCFWDGDTLANPYYWFDLLLSCAFLLFLPALRKAVGR